MARKDVEVDPELVAARAAEEAAWVAYVDDGRTMERAAAYDAACRVTDEVMQRVYG